VCIRTFNRLRELDEALDSVAKQTYRNLEIVVVNDGGPPVDAIVAKYPMARIISLARNGGPFVAGNAALRTATGDWIAFLDDDDLWFRDHLASMMSAAQRSGLRAVCGQAIFRNVIHEADDRRTVVALSHPGIAQYDLRRLAATNTVLSPAFLFHRSLLAEAGEFDTSILRANDYEFYLRLAQRTPFAAVNEITAVYTISNERRNRSLNRPEEFIPAHEQIYAKHPTEDSFVLENREATLARIQRAVDKTQLTR
jgi:glycosyltransferase involved in cell wall biosynthesis